MSTAFLAAQAKTANDGSRVLYPSLQTYQCSASPIVSVRWRFLDQSRSPSNRKLRVVLETNICGRNQDTGYDRGPNMTAVLDAGWVQ
jgi:hypothetical protein